MLRDRLHVVDLLNKPHRHFDVTILCCLAVTILAAQKTVSQDGVSLTYETAMFSRIKIVELKKEPLPNPHDRLNVHPANLLFLF
jgi:hypothetical protein